jgi:uncharacterized oligopeptide transporter (OPT) family protein
MGSLLGIVLFALSSVYLGLKVGLTVSASIPVAVLSITLFRWLRLRGTILENNIVQTTGSAGESLAAGVAFTLPSLLIMGFELEFMRVLLVALLGGLIGVLMMIPLRHGLIVKEHGHLAYPEGTACADVLDRRRARRHGREDRLHRLLRRPLLYVHEPDQPPVVGHRDLRHRLLGAAEGRGDGVRGLPADAGRGVHHRPKVSANMLAGGLLAFVILIPLIHTFGDSMLTPMYPETTKTIAQMSAYQIRSNYILYIGAGAVATGGFISWGARSRPSSRRSAAGSPTCRQARARPRSSWRARSRTSR